MPEKIVHPHDLEGLFELVRAKPPERKPNYTEDKYEQVKQVFWIGQQIICLHIIEVVLKYIYQESNMEYEKNHDIQRLFMGLGEEGRKKIEGVYNELAGCNVPETYDVTKSAQSLIEFFGKKPVVDMRYFWEEYENVPIFRVELINLFQSILIAACGFPHVKLEKKHTTKYKPIPESIKIHKKQRASK